MKIHCEYTRLVPISELRPHPKNPKKHSPEAIERQAQVMDYQGWRRPVTVSNLSGVMTAGHKRVLAAKLRGHKEVPVSFQDYESEEQEIADLVADNALNEWELTDLSAVNALIGELGPDFDIDLLGIKDFEIEPADKYNSEGEDDVSPTPAIARTRSGDLFLLGNHRLLCGDSTDKDQVARLMNGEKATLWSSDPPYGINHVDTSQEKGQSDGYARIQNDDLQFDELKTFLEKVIRNFIEVGMADGFAFYMWHAMKMQSYAAAAAAAAGILFHRQIIWVKPSLVFGRGQYHWRHELCLMGWLQGKECAFYGERNQTTVWELGRENDKIHPTQKPVAITEIPIANHTKRNEIVTDPFLGSGSTLIACEKTGRRCFGSEIDPLYCDVIIERWQKFSGKTAYLIEDASGKLQSGPVSYAEMCSMRLKTPTDENKDIAP